MQIMSTSSTYKALHTPWCLSILVGQVTLYIISPLCFWLEMTMKLDFVLNYV